MARSTPRVQGTRLVDPRRAGVAVAVDTPAWFAWLDEATTFAFAGEGGTFTARKERGSHGGWYWKAYRRRGGVLRSAYLGRTSDVTLARLTAVAEQIVRREAGDLEIPGIGRPVPPPPEDVRVYLLGGFRVHVGGRPVADDAWRLRKARSLVKLLALARDHALHRERLLDLLWPDVEPAAAGANLRHTLHVARRALGPGDDPTSSPLQLRDDRLLLRPPGGLWVDVDAFADAATTARRVRDPAAYTAALALYAGDLLPEDRYEDWAAARRQALRETHVGLLVDAARLHEERGEQAEAVLALRGVVEREPTHEEAHAGLMHLYARTGRRDQALRQYRQLQDALRRELDAVPDPKIALLAADIQAGRFPPPGAEPGTARPAQNRPAPSNLPVPLTSFVAREGDVDQIRRLVTGTGSAPGEPADASRRPAPRLVTLTGPGGCGKSRLALAAAQGLDSSFPDGLWLVELAPLADRSLVPVALATALGIRGETHRPPVATLAAALHARSTLLIMDNCEHLIDACADLAQALLARCPGVRIVATSREVLGVEGEVVRPVPPLALPDAGQLDLTGPALVAALDRVPAVRLFVERAAAAAPGFALTPENAPLVARICRRLDGLPLALELAAARVRFLALEQIAARLDDSFELLAGGSRTALPRHRTLHAAIDWSYQLLPDPERALFCRLAVFAGGWTLDALQQLAPGSVDLLGRLVDKSLVQVDGHGGEPRYHQLETVRQYARAELAASGEADAARRRHAAHFLSLAEATPAILRGPGQLAWLDRLEEDLDNFRAAMGAALEAGEVEPALRLASGLERFWQYHARLSEGRRWLERGLEADAGVPAALRAGALGLLGWLVRFLDGPSAAQPLLEDAFDLFRELGDRRGMANVRDSLGDAAFFLGDLDQALALHAENLRQRRALGDRWGVAMTLNSLGWVVQAQGDPDRAKDLLEECLAIVRELGDLRGTAMSLGGLGLIALDLGDLPRAAAWTAEGLTLMHALGNRVDVALNVEALAVVAARLGQAARAARLFGAAEALAETIGGLGAIATWLTQYDRHLTDARAGSDPTAWTAAWTAGRTLPLGQAVAEALELARGVASA